MPCTALICMPALVAEKWEVRSSWKLCASTEKCASHKASLYGFRGLLVSEISAILSLAYLKAPSQWTSSPCYTALWTVAFAVPHLRFLSWDHVNNAPPKCRCLFIHVVTEEQGSLSTASLWALRHPALIQTPFCTHLLACKAWLYSTKAVLVLMQCILFLPFLAASVDIEIRRARMYSRFTPESL